MSRSCIIIMIMIIIISSSSISIIVVVLLIIISWISLCFATYFIGCTQTAV